MAKKNKKKKYQMSKVLTGAILLVALIDLQLSYILAFMGKEDAETLSVAIVTEIVAVVLGYFIKSFNETKEAERIKLQNAKLQNERSEREETITENGEEL
ncbi:MAG: hypothetical protein NC086_08280 [Alistipes sp.]|nr:hypothetical protein [Alistipes sp.]